MRDSAGARLPRSPREPIMDKRSTKQRKRKGSRTTAYKLTIRIPEGTRRCVSGATPKLIEGAETRRTQ